MAWPSPVCVCVRRGRWPRVALALRRARGPDEPGAVLLPSPRQANPLTRIDLHCWNASGLSAGAPPCDRAEPDEGRKNVGRPQHHSKSEIGVPIVRFVPVADRTARVVRVVVPRAPAHHLPRPPHRMLTPGERMIVERVSPRFAREVTKATSSRVSRLRVQRDQRAELTNRGRPQHPSKSEIAVPIARSEPAAACTARVVRVAEPRAPAHHPVDVLRGR